MELYNANCFDVFPKLADNSVDLVIVDLPYGQTDLEWDVHIDLNKMWTQLKRIGKDNTAFVFFTTTRFGYTLIHSNPKMFKYDLVWKKDTSSRGF
jgi:site-specific DNA-methyltransferase (adenine-specific)